MSLVAILSNIFILTYMCVLGEGKYIDVSSLTEPPKKSTIDVKKLELMLNPDSENSTGFDTTCTSGNGIQSLSGISQERYRWRNGYFVQLDPKWNSNEAALINDALYELSTKICIPIKIYKAGTKPSGDYSFILKKSGGCSSPVGKQGGKQTINLDPNGCMMKGIIMHENIHALGFTHEQNRPDRDKYVTVYTNNIDRGHRHNYDIASGSLTFGVPYDFKSIMHYGSFDFSEPKSKPAMLKKDGSKIVKQRDGLTNYDVEKLRKMYNCK